MRIALTCPGFAPHGGIRVILEWANRLAARGHDVTVLSKAETGHEWFGLRGVRVERDAKVLMSSDMLIVCSPHDVDYLTAPGPARRFVFMQMAEHMFHPENRAWQDKCRRFYLADCPLILISRWNERVIREMGRTGRTHYVGNGVNLEHFPVRRGHDAQTVLVEGWWPTNPTKDTARLGPRVAARLQRLGFTILAYGLVQHPRDPFRLVPNKFHVRPPLEVMNELYERASILIKATRYDARSCAPMEAMAKGTVTARAIIEGDDDLVDGENCLRVGYDEDALFDAALRLLLHDEIRVPLAENAIEYVQRYNWDYHMDRIEEILCSD